MVTGLAPKIVPNPLHVRVTEYVPLTFAMGDSCVTVIVPLALHVSATNRFVTVVSGPEMTVSSTVKVPVMGPQANVQEPVTSVCGVEVVPVGFGASLFEQPRIASAASIRIPERIGDPLV